MDDSDGGAPPRPQGLRTAFVVLPAMEGQDRLTGRGMPGGAGEEEERFSKPETDTPEGVTLESKVE